MVACLFIKGKKRFVLFCIATVWVVRIIDIIDPIKFYKAVRTDLIVWSRERNTEKLDRAKDISGKTGKLVLGGNQTGIIDLYDIEKNKIFSCSLQAGEAFFPVGVYTVHKYEAIFRDSNGGEWEFKYRFNYATERRVIRISQDSVVTHSFGPPFRLMTRLSKKDSSQVEVTGLVVDSLQNRYTIDKKTGHSLAVLNVVDTAGNIIYKDEFPCGCGGKYSREISRKILSGKTFRCEIDFGQVPFIEDKIFPLYRIDGSGVKDASLQS